MPVVNIPASKSLSVSNNNRDIYIDNITIGRGRKSCYYSYIFFDLSCLTNDISLISAKLVLFKVNNFTANNSIIFSIYPLYDYFSSYTYYEKPCRIDKELRKEFNPFTQDTSIEIEITDIVEKWITNKLSNKGLMIKDTTHKDILSICDFGSAYTRDNTLIPFLSITYLNKSPFSPLPDGIKISTSVFPSNKK